MSSGLPLHPVYIYNIYTASCYILTLTDTSIVVWALIGPCRISRKQTKDQILPSDKHGRWPTMDFTLTKDKSHISVGP